LSRRSTRCSLEIDRVIHALPVTIAAFEAAEYGLYREAKREGFCFESPESGKSRMSGVVLSVR